MSKQQLARTCINVGYVADAKNVIIPDPICTNLMIGLDEDDYFKSSPGARKGLIDKADSTPQSGLNNIAPYISNDIKQTPRIQGNSKVFLML
jgi:hypothetical protein